MGLKEVLENPIVTFVIGLPVGYIGGHFIKNGVTGYLEGRRELWKQDMKQILVEYKMAEKALAEPGAAYSGAKEILAAIDRLSGKIDTIDSRVGTLEKKYVEKN
jgi:hypothetical protein